MKFLTFFYLSLFAVHSLAAADQALVNEKSKITSKNLLKEKNNYDQTAFNIEVRREREWWGKVTESYLLRKTESPEVSSLPGAHSGQKGLIQSSDSANCQTNLSCFNPSTTSNQLYDLENDEKVCDCLSSRFDIKFQDLTKASSEEIAKRDEKISQGKLLAALWELQKKYARKRDALLIEAHLVNDKERFKLLYNATLTTETIEGLKTAVQEEFKGKVSDEFLNKSLEMVDNFTGQDSSSRTIMASFNKRNSSKDSCFPFSEYLKISMVPDSPAFWNELLENKDFPKNEDSWNYDGLAFLYSVSQGQERERIGAKLNFLNRNPTLKTIFSYGKPEEKKEAYKALRDSLKPTKECIIANNCQSKFISSGGDLQRDLKNIYKNRETTATVSGATYVDVLSDIGDVSLAAYSKPNLHALRFAYSQDGMLYNECNETTEGSKKVALCSDYFENYCAEVKAGRGDLRHTLDQNDKLGAYNNDWMDDLEPDPRKNHGYLKFQDQMCRQMIRTLPGSQNKVNFYGYKKDICSKINCSNISDSDLFKRFIQETEDSGLLLADNGLLVPDTQGFGALARASADNRLASQELSDREVDDIGQTGSLSYMGNPANKPRTQSIDDILNQITSPLSGTAPGLTDIATANEIKNTSIFSDDGMQDLVPEIGTNLLGSETVNNLPSFSPGYVAHDDSSTEALNDARNELNQLKKQEAAIKNEITQVKTEIQSGGNSDNRALEMRLENLEKLLAEKEKSAKGYQDLISKLVEQQTNSQNRQEKAPSTVAASPGTSEAPKKVSSNSTVASGRPQLSEESNIQQRSPASVESFSTSSSAMGGGSVGSFSSVSKAAASSRGKINSALLSKYGIMVQENTSSPVSVAAEADGARFQLMSSFKEAANIPVEVPLKAFEKFKSNDLTALQELYKDSIKDMGEGVVKLLVSSEGSNETLEFYAIKEDGKVVFQPIRKHTLSVLRSTLSYQ